MSLATIRIVLFEPAGPRNVGAIARVMKNMGLQKLVVVNPQCDLQGSEAQQMAVHAQDVLAAARVVATLPDALAGCDRALATTARECAEFPIEPPRQVLPWLLQSPTPSALIFGREDRGLSNQELNYAQRWLKIPVNPDYSSLNLAQAVGICCHELHQASEMSDVAPPSLPQGQSSRGKRATLDQLEGYYQDLEALLREIGYLHPHTAAARMAKFRQLYNRAVLAPEEVAMLRGIVRQTRWAAGDRSPPTSSLPQHQAIAHRIIRSRPEP
ncbi:MAG: RNA methyltransferase [Spirulinaceae cyanobacterium]